MSEETELLKYIAQKDGDYRGGIILAQLTMLSLLLDANVFSSEQALERFEMCLNQALPADKRSGPMGAALRAAIEWITTQATEGNERPRLRLIDGGLSSETNPR